MNKVFILVLVLGIGGIAAFSGCSKDHTYTNYYMKAYIGSTQFEAGNCMASISGTTLAIQSLNNSAPILSYPYFEIAIQNWFGALGTYNLATVLGHPHMIFYNSATDHKISMYGTVTINAVNDNLISGTFQYTNTDTVTISSGTFTAKVYK
jgi:hypothetical protein